MADAFVLGIKIAKARSYQNHDLIMSNRKFTTARAAAFWLGLVLHLGLGTALYYQVHTPFATQPGRAAQAEPITLLPAKP